MASVEYIEATRWYDENSPPAVDMFSLAIDDGEFVALVGPSGSGKSTALRMLAGLEPLDEGRIRIGDQDVGDLEPKARDIAMVFQSYALYPHMSVYENMAFALRSLRIRKEEIRKRVDEAATLLELGGLLDRKPKQLSGGQRQRVAMGRAIVRHPQAFLMDEPLSNLDAKLRVQTRTQIAALQQRLECTTVYVTHDQTEAMTMGDRVAVLHEGRLQQVATPREIYAKPANTFVAGFIGSPAMNLLTVPLGEDGAQLEGTAIPLPREKRDGAVGNGQRGVVVGIRPEGFELAQGEEAGVLSFPAILIEELGADAYVYGQIAEDTRVVVRVDGKRMPEKGDIVRVKPRVDECHIFSVVDGVRL